MAEQLSWEEWQEKANAAYVKGQYGAQQMIADWGYPAGMTAEGYKIEFDKGKVKRKDRIGRRAQRARATSQRQTAIQAQTVGPDVYGKGVVAPKGSQLQEHHKRVVGLYKPFFEGLNPAETKELAQWFVDEGAPLGNVQKNLEALTEQEHESIHAWMKKHRMQVSNKKFPSFKNVPLNERFPAVLTYLEQIQPAADEELARIKQTRLIDDFTPAQRRALNAAPLPNKEKLVRQFRGLPVLGVAVGGGIAATQLMQGKPAAAAETLFDTAVSEIPIVDVVLEPASTADATLKGRTDPEAYAAQYKKERQKAKQEQSNFITNTLKLISDAI